MATDYSVELCKTLQARFKGLELERPQRVERYENGTQLSYEVTGVEKPVVGRVKLMIEKFVGGGFAGQVYRVKLIEIETDGNEIAGLQAGQSYAMKILIPPSGFSRIFRNIIYRIGFQGPFQLQVNPAASRAGALWQKFIRRAAAIRFGDERSVVDIHATFIDQTLGSGGELSEWVDGRTWLLEVDERMDQLRKWRKNKNLDYSQLGSAEYRAKKIFMMDFVKLLREMGAFEFARQYEWSTCKSQPNCLKRSGSDSDPKAGLTAVDFRAGLALLFFLPMSPGDIKLIFMGLARGSLVQFDRGSIARLESFIKANGDSFDDMADMLDDLKACEKIYRDSIPDITHNHIRLLYSPKLWSTMFDRAVTSWKVRNLIDEGPEQKLRKSKFSTILFYLLGAIPFLGRFLRKIWARADWRKHYRNILTNPQYVKKAVQGKLLEKAIKWHRSGRTNPEQTRMISQSLGLYLCNLPLCILPAGLHRFLTDWTLAKQKLWYILVRPVKLYFNANMREQWLLDMVDQGQKKHMLSDEDARVIHSQIKEPFIQKYLKSLAVHVCTLPVTQVVSVTIALIYVYTHPDLPRAQAWATGAAIIGLFQVIPISPGSLVRGLYVLYLVIRERNFKDYNIAVFLGFFKYVGYLAFPIQMTHRYPAMARFMAGHWATEAVHIIPVFGERGALLEHWVFCLFYNWPLTIRRRMRLRAEARSSIEPRYWHVGLCALAGAGVFAAVEFLYLKKAGYLPSLSQIWWLSLSVPVLCGALITLGAGGAALWRRLVCAAVGGIAVGAVYTLFTLIMDINGLVAVENLTIVSTWRIFSFAIFSTIGAIFTELMLPEPNIS